MLQNYKITDQAFWGFKIHLPEYLQHKTKPLVKSAHQKYNFLIPQPKHMLWVLK